MKRLAFLTTTAAAVLLLAAGSALAAYSFQGSWGTPGAGAGQFNNPGLIAVGPDGSVVVADTGNQRVEIFDPQGAFSSTFGSAGAGQGQFNSPTAVAVGPSGDIYVADSGNRRIQHFSSGGAFIFAWGSAGVGQGQFGANIAGIATDSGGNVYVADVDNKRVEKFLQDGTYLQDITSGLGGFGTISGVAVGPGGLYVVDQGLNRVEFFDLNGGFQGSWGSAGAGDGQFNAPRGVAASAAGVYVADSGNNRVEKFTDTGAFVDQIDATSGDPAFAGPVGVGTSSTGTIYVAQPAQARISFFNDTSGGGTLPPPTTGQTANADPVNGTVKVKTPGSNQFTLLAAGQQIPIGSIVDVTKGTVDLTTTASSTTTQTARFYSGVFKLTQPKSANPVTELQLFGGDFKKGCPTPRSRKSAFEAKKKVVRQLWGSGKGNFRTKGKYASASIRGTQWLTQDRCDGTSVHVAEGSVTVRDLVKKKNVVVNAPKTYLAKAPLRKRR